MRQLRKYRALSRSARTIVLHSLLLLPIAATLLRTRGMARAASWLERRRRAAVSIPGALAPQEIARLVTATASILGTRCLPRSLVLQHLLRNRGVATEIHLGVSKHADGSLAAHAWIEHKGLPLNDSLDVYERYAALRSSADKVRIDRP